MLQQLNLDLRLNLKMFLYLLAMSVGGFVFGSVLLFFAMTMTDDPGTWFYLGTLLSMTFSAAFLIFFYAFSYKCKFTLALSMGRTRSSFMLSQLCILTLDVLLAYGLALLFYAVESAYCPIVYADYPLEFSFSFLMNWRFFLPVLVIVPFVTLFIATMYAHFGKTAGIILYFVWLFCFMVLPRTIHVTVQDPGPLNRAAYGIKCAFLAAPIPMLVGLGILLFAAMLSFTWIWGKRQLVK